MFKEAMIKYGFVIPAQAGIQDVQVVTGSPPSRGRLNQRFLNAKGTNKSMETFEWNGAS